MFGTCHTYFEKRGGAGPPRALSAFTSEKRVRVHRTAAPCQKYTWTIHAGQIQPITNYTARQTSKGVRHADSCHRLPFGRKLRMLEKRMLISLFLRANDDMTPATVRQTETLHLGPAYHTARSFDWNARWVSGPPKSTHGRYVWGKCG